MSKVTTLPFVQNANPSEQTTNVWELISFLEHHFFEDYALDLEASFAIPEPHAEDIVKKGFSIARGNAHTYTGNTHIHDWLENCIKHARIEYGRSANQQKIEREITADISNTALDEVCSEFARKGLSQQQALRHINHFTANISEEEKTALLNGTLSEERREALNFKLFMMARSGPKLISRNGQRVEPS